SCVSLMNRLYIFSPIPNLPSFFFSMLPPPPISTLFPYTTLFRSLLLLRRVHVHVTRPDVLPHHHSLVHRIARLHKHRPALLQIRSEEHTSELQSRGHLVCRLLLEKKK